MSRIGRAPITIPPGVEVKISDANVVSVKGPKGALEQAINHGIKIDVEGAAISLTRPNDTPRYRSLHGLSRTLINNMIVGVTDGFTKELEISGVGYRAALEGGRLLMNIGFSHQVVIDKREGLSIDVPAPNRIVVSGIDKQAVGQFAADIRKTKPPEPYMGKGIKYAGEVVRRKEGKTGAK